MSDTTLRKALEEIASYSVNEYWCKLCQTDVDKDHKHWRSCVPISSVPAADGYRHLISIAIAALPGPDDPVVEEER